MLCALHQFGDNPERTRLEAEVAKLRGTWPIPASSGQINRHQLCSGGHLRSSPAFSQLVIVRTRNHQRPSSSAVRLLDLRRWWRDGVRARRA